MCSFWKEACLPGTPRGPGDSGRSKPGRLPQEDHTGRARHTTDDDVCPSSCFRLPSRTRPTVVAGPSQTQPASPGQPCHVGVFPLGSPLSHCIFLSPVHCRPGWPIRRHLRPPPPPWPWQDISVISTVTECAPGAGHHSECHLLGLRLCHPQSHPWSAVTIPSLSFEETEAQSSEVLRLGPHSPCFSSVLPPPGERAPAFFPAGSGRRLASWSLSLLKCSRAGGNRVGANPLLPAPGLRTTETRWGGVGGNPEGRGVCRLWKARTHVEPSQNVV